MNPIVNAQPISNAACLADEISTLYAHINVATSVLLEKIQQFDEQGLYVRLQERWSTCHRSGPRSVQAG